MGLAGREMENESLPLSALKVGESGRIIKLNLKGTTRQRFMAMGLVRGEVVRVERVAPLGDPVEFVVKGYHLSVRKSEADQIVVIPCGNESNDAP